VICTTLQSEICLVTSFQIILASPHVVIDILHNLSRMASAGTFFLLSTIINNQLSTWTAQIFFLAVVYNCQRLTLTGALSDFMNMYCIFIFELIKKTFATNTATMKSCFNKKAYIILMIYFDSFRVLFSERHSASPQ